jgi:hypothetical protein
VSGIVDLVTTELFLRDVFDLPEAVHAGDFKVELSGGFTETEQRVAEYVVTDQLREAFGKALSLVRAAVRTGSSHAAYLHGSFGSGKSHFLTVLHAILNDHPAARAKPGLQAVIAEHDDWLRGRRFLMVPYHLVGATDIGSAILGGYVATVRRLHPEQPTPAVYRADALLDDARRQRAFLADDVRFAQWLTGGSPSGAGPGAGALDDDLDVIGEDEVATWTAADLDRALAAPAGDPAREALVSALLSGPMSAYGRRAAGDAGAFVPLENGLSVLTRHAKQLGYDGVVLFLDELILWLQAHMANQEFVNDQVSTLVKLIESGVAERALPIVSFVSRQRDLSQLVGADVTGADVKNLEAQVQYLAHRFDVVSLEDRNLPAIIKERVLTVRPGPGRAALEQAFAGVESANAVTRDVLLDPHGATGATWQDFKEVYPLSPALLNVLVALSGALQRERTGLKLLQEMLYRRRADMRLGQLIPLGDLWDVLGHGTGEAFTDRLRKESEAAQRFYTKARAYLVGKYGSDTDERFVADDRFVKTLLLAALTPDVPALTRLTGARLAALNHGSIRTRVSTPGAVVVSRLRELQAEFGELRAEGDEDPVFSLHLTDLDLEPLLDAVGQQDSLGARRIWVKDQLWRAFGVRDAGQFVCEREVVWRGTRRTVELVFANVRDEVDLPDAQFAPSASDRVRIVLDYPFDIGIHSPADDAKRVRELRQRGVNVPTLVWLPHFLSDQRRGQLGRLLRMTYLLERDRLADYAAHLGSDDQVKVRHQLQAQRDTLTSQLVAVLRQLYGISGGDEANVGGEVVDGHVVSLLQGVSPRLLGGAGFEQNLLTLTDAVLAARYPKHPDFDPTGTRKPVTPGDLRSVRGWIARAMETGERRTLLERSELPLARRIVHALELGEVHDGPLNVSTEWRRRIDQLAAQHEAAGDLDVETIRAWIAEAGWTGLDRPVVGLIIATYALLADRAWVYQGTVEANAPDLDRIGPGWALRAQDLPGEDHFTIARQRAAVLFGVKAPQVLFARNVARLANDVRQQAAGVENAVNGLRQALDLHAADLGLDAGPADAGPADAGPAARVVSAREAAELVARLRDTRDATALVTELATARYDSSDSELAAALQQAGRVLEALNQLDWSLLNAVTGFVSRPDAVGRRAQRILGEVRTTATATQFERDLVPVLRAARAEAVALIAEIGRIAPVGPTGPTPSPTPPLPRPAPPVPGPERPGQVELPDVDQATKPSVPRPTPAPTRAVRRVRATAAEKATAVEQAMASLLDEVRRDLEAYRAAHGGADIEIEFEWRFAPSTGDLPAPGGPAA